MIMKTVACIFFVLCAMPHACRGGEPSLEQGEAFLKDCAAKAASAEGMSIHGKDDWFFLKGELRHLGAGDFWDTSAGQGDGKDPLSAILHFKDQLDKQGIELVLVPVPPKAVIYPEKLSDVLKAEDAQHFIRADSRHQRFYKLLRERGINVVDLAPEFIAQRFNKDAAPIYCRTDTHWSGSACVIAAQLIAKELQNRDWLKNVAKKKFDVEEKAVAVRGDLVPQDADEKIGTENLRLRFVGHRKSPEQVLWPLSSDPSSPVLLLSDSHGLVFNIGDDLFAKGAGLPDQLANELGFPIDLLASKGDGVTKVRIDLFQRVKADPAWLATKKVVIWCFSARDFTECANGWRKIPLKK